MARMRRLAEEALKGPEGSQVGDEQRTGRASVGGNWRGTDARWWEARRWSPGADVRGERILQPRVATSVRLEQQTQQMQKHGAVFFSPKQKPLPRAGSWTRVGWGKEFST